MGMCPAEPAASLLVLCWVQTIVTCCTCCQQGDFCTNCGAPFLRSFITFEVLPLVEFELEPGISDPEALVSLHCCLRRL